MLTLVGVVPPPVIVIMLECPREKKNRMNIFFSSFVSLPESSLPESSLP